MFTNMTTATNDCVRQSSRPLRQACGPTDKRLAIHGQPSANSDSHRNLLALRLPARTLAHARSLSPTKYEISCSPITPTGINMFFLDKAWYYMLMKAGEMLDTLFFVLRKKTRHLSFLHLLHHSLALWSVWLVLTLGITGHVYSFPLLNSAVHVVMYIYYALSALEPAMRPKLWWKKYVTLFQIIQFTALALHALIPVVVDCGISRVLAFVGALEGILFASLFTDFYYTAYVRQRSKTR
ncbi:hypothetical protein HPB49_008850 [Dermacentor silvarum]|uniref:Uncharacterized protein n=1 Tax=Dermacentor silvarum TaxID=543639 RepID=A0ACB8C8F1_DERSI|nr:hypothetical protein HPB49_008850 [Dermacentor silvarum]